ncbi:hypothetical protein ONE63_011076 [Megalurothrips usitatus]|uniref:Uncharacterized protein n=1 Tax=Megalurothrips usitatus TaxID=439358 RepID=A0AAV7XJL2_9NEOP|nr:hypothetical protein ONE63_011076 [Megalurothrips usitatus]
MESENMALITEEDMIAVLDVAKLSMPQLYRLTEKGSAGLKRAVLEYCGYHYTWMGPDRASVNSRDLNGKGWDVFKKLTIVIEENWEDSRYVEKAAEKIEAFLAKFPGITEVTLDFGCERISLKETLGDLKRLSWQPSRQIVFG